MYSLSNFSISLPVSSQTAHSALNPNPLLFPRFSHSPTALISCRNGPGVVKAMAREEKDNLDHLQRQNKLQNQQPRKRPAPSAPIGLWDRFPTARTVQQMMETMERMMDDPLAYSGAGRWPSPSGDTAEYSRGRTPWEIKEAESEYKMRFDMPGMTKEDAKVWVEDKMLVVKAEKLPENENEEESGNEWSAKSYGRYSCRIALPENVVFEKIKAEVKDGVLYIAIPKASSTAKVFDINVQ